MAVKAVRIVGPIPRTLDRCYSARVGVTQQNAACYKLDPMNSVPAKFKRVQERHYSAHHDLIRIAKLQLSIAEAQEPGWFNNAFIAITFSALAIEALSNAVGDRVVPEWKDFESASPTAKIRLLAERLDVSYSSDTEPWQTIRWLGKFRNLVAHPKPQVVVKESLVTASEAHERPHGPPDSKLEQQVTIGNARQAVAALEKAKLALCEKTIPRGAL